MSKKERESGVVSERGICEGCRFQKESKQYPCNHPIVGEEVTGVLGSGHFEIARAYAKIRERLGLEFKERSWDVIECRGRKES